MKDLSITVDFDIWNYTVGLEIFPYLGFNHRRVDLSFLWLVVSIYW